MLLINLATIGYLAKYIDEGCLVISKMACELNTQLATAFLATVCNTTRTWYISRLVSADSIVFCEGK